MNDIIFQGTEYPIITVNMPFGERIISTEHLNEALMNSDGSYEARTIDERIFYFVEDNILSFRENEIVNKILSEI